MFWLSEPERRTIYSRNLFQSRLCSVVVWAWAKMRWQTMECSWNCSCVKLFYVSRHQLGSNAVMPYVAFAPNNRLIASVRFYRCLVRHKPLFSFIRLAVAYKMMRDGSRIHWSEFIEARRIIIKAIHHYFYRLQSTLASTTLTMWQPQIYLHFCALTRN